MNITGGDSIEVLGGFYSCNGTGASPPFAYSQTGIAITGTSSGVRVTGVACNNTVYDTYTSPPAFATATQKNGVYISGGASSVRVLSCDLTGNLSYGAFITGGVTNIFVKHCDFTGLANPINVVTAGANVQVTDCPGYNDQATVLQNSIPPPSNPITNASFGYYGPIAFYIKGAGHVTIDGVDTNLTDGGYTLSSGETASIAGTATHFLAVGK
jgi:hypothetical protein